MTYSHDPAFAQAADEQDELKHFRKQFHIPVANGREQIYFLGNSLGLQPVTTASAISEVLGQWSQYGVEGFFYGKKPWLDYHDSLVGPLSKIVGALPQEVVVMNQLTVNLHLMMASFYKPSRQRNKIVCEARAFPSDRYMLETQMRHHGLDPQKSIIEVCPRNGEYHIRTEDIIAAIEKHAGELAMVLWGGVNYYTGQVFDIQSITTAAHNAGAIAGFDLAHAAGNIILKLHDWNVDFACWCSYKYLNSGPGGVGGAFIHERYHQNDSINRFAGWWGHDKPSRFKMPQGFVPVHSAEGWQLSTPSMLLYAVHSASLAIFEAAGMEKLVNKGSRLGDYLIFLLKDKVTIINPCSKGSQISLLIKKNGRKVFDQLSDHNIFADWREPDIIRVAPVPLYNTFSEVFQFAQAIKKLIQ
jgi:kynureninase